MKSKINSNLCYTDACFNYTFRYTIIFCSEETKELHKPHIYDLPDFVLSIEKASKIFIPGKAPRIEQLKDC